MIVIDKNNEVAEFFNRIARDEFGIVRVDTTTFELANGLNTEVVCISAESYLELSTRAVTKLKESFGVFILNLNDDVIDFLLPNVINIFSGKEREELVISQINFAEEKSKESNILKSQFISLNRELSNIMGGVESQLLRVKKAYELKTPKRLEELKAFKVMSKYAAGEDLGGEFFDIFTKNNKVFLMMSSTSSYLLSSSILQEFTFLRTKQEITEAEEKAFIENIQEELAKVNKSKKKEVTLDLLTAIIDINTLKLQGHAVGQFAILSSNMSHNKNLSNDIKTIYEDTSFSLQLDRGERILFNSPGFLKSWNSTQPKFMIEELVVNSKIKALDILDEIFFQIKKDSINGFLSNDASSLLIEVEKNAMVKI